MIVGFNLRTLLDPQSLPMYESIIYASMDIIGIILFLMVIFNEYYKLKTASSKSSIIIIIYFALSSILLFTSIITLYFNLNLLTTHILTMISFGIFLLSIIVFLMIFLSKILSISKRDTLYKMILN